MNQPIYNSRRFWTAVFGLLAMVIVAYFPEFTRFEGVFVENATLIIIALIAGYSVEDVAKQWFSKFDVEAFIEQLKTKQGD